MGRSAARRRVIALAVAALLVGLSFIPPTDVVGELLVSDGLDRFAGEARGAGRHALDRAPSRCADEPGNRLLRRRFRVVAVELAPGYCPDGRIRAYQAILRTYTVFAIPTGEVTISCGLC